MYEVDFIGVGETASADAIGLRFSNPHTGGIAHVLIDGGWQQDGDAVVDHIARFYGSRVDLVVCTHPDGDHIGGLGQVIRECTVGTLWIHRPVVHGAPTEEGYGAAEDLIQVAVDYGVAVQEPWAGATAFGGALMLAGPSENYYLECLQDQLSGTRQAAAATTVSLSARLLEGAQSLLDRALTYMPVEVPFGDAGGTDARNNSSMVLSLLTGSQRFLFTADAGVPALDHALDMIDQTAHANVPVTVFKLPHHGSRHNLDLVTIRRALDAQSEHRHGLAMVTLAPKSDGKKLPSGRVTNACSRRGYPVFTNREGTATYSGEGSTRSRGTPLQPLPPLEEETD